nr:hypothetical protein [uncultured Neokomagataea sp.]
MLPHRSGPASPATRQLTEFAVDRSSVAFQDSSRATLNTAEQLPNQPIKHL